MRNLVLLVVLAAGAGCGEPTPDELLSDFALADVNPASPTFDTEVSPRDFVGKVSAWYFGHAT
jgi:hypothetical protein